MVIVMATITVKNIPDELYDLVKQSAKAQHRSINNEIIACLERSFLSKSVDVTTFPERVHVRCSTAASGGIIYFAVPTANNESAARILSTLLAGHIAGRTLVIGYDTTDTSGTAFGCAQNDCRRLLYVGIQ